ncbi:hypothetical protein GCM10023185_34150 [Hymenobacter saemangeumensis]|uniref:DUF6438 domain-containing protein n=1 Tax=Hymenobacter saemangeumensis TaxID=1084522 RepID=A0ABP8INQ4_9BACT
MKTLYTWVVLAGAGLLPACTVHYHGVGPDGRTRVVNHYHTDTVYVQSTNTTVITQPGVVGGPRGGYAGNGPVRGGYGQPGSVQTPPPGNYPPPRNNGGIRTPPAGQPGPSPAGSNNPNPPVRNPPIRTTPPGPVRNPGSGTTPGTGSQTPGGTGTTAGTATHAPSGGAPQGSNSPAPGSTAGGGGSGGQAPQGYTTGGIKPIPTTSTPVPPTSAPIGASGETPGPRTGGIKPVRPTKFPTEPVATPASEYPTGGIKPIPGSTASGSVAVASTLSEDTPHNFQTGGIKPIPGGQSAPAGEVPTTPGTGAPAEMPGTENPGNGGGTQAVPALMFAKMPCRGTCPAYTATVWPNGRVVYVGQHNVPRVGTYELRLDPSVVADIQRQAQGLGFGELQASYASGNTDIPATMLTIYSASGSSKTVSVEDTAPAEVQALFDNIHGTLSQLVANSEYSEEKPRNRKSR